MNEGWISIRHRMVEGALKEADTDSLRRISALSGGFGDEASRRMVWPVLLDTKRYFGSTPSSGAPDQPGKRLKRAVSEEGKEEKEDRPPAYPDHTTSDEPASHPDEAQVLLDTKRSFVSYPTSGPAESKVAMQADLRHLIVHVIRKFPELHYFQGFHDIMSVLYLSYIPPLHPAIRSQSGSKRSQPHSDQTSRSGSAPPSRPITPAAVRSRENVKPSPGRAGEQADANETEKVEGALPEETNRDTPEWRALKQCAEVVSLCRVRDAMSLGLEPMMGLLRMLERLMRIADPELAEYSGTISPVPTLPFFALSWILCLFSHDVDTLESVQRMFDFLLARNPISVIYLAVAILVSKKDQMFKLAKGLGPDAEDDPGLLHPLFSRLPPLYPDTPDHPNPLPSADPNSHSRSRDDDSNPFDPIPLSRIFALTDDLLARFPWDGNVIRGREIMSDASVVCTYEKEEQEGWTLKEAEQMANKEIVRPGATDIDEEETLPPPVKRVWVRRPKNRLGTAMAVGVVFVGIGMAVYGYRAGDHAARSKWWSLIIHSWLGKKWQAVSGYHRVIMSL